MFILTIFMVLSLIAEIWSQSNTVTVFTDAAFKGNKVQVNATDCVPHLPDGFEDSISSINTEGHCVNLYKDAECKGDYIVMKPGTPAHNYISRWEDFNDETSSIGPCYEYCDPRNDNPRPEKLPTVVTIFDHSDYKGFHMDIDIKEDCAELPRKLKRRVSSIIKSDERTCIEFHENWNCTGQLLQLRKGTPHHENLGWWALNDNTAAISLCGFRCNRTEPMPRNWTSPGANVVTLYDEVDYNGNFKNFDLGSGCRNISDEWEGESHSIQIYGQCCIIYERFGCSRRDRNVFLDNSNLNVHRQLKSKKFDQTVRSIQLCSSSSSYASEMGAGDGTINSSSGSYQIITFTILGLFLIGLALGALIIIRLKRNHKRVVEILTGKEIEEFLRGCDNPALDGESVEFLAQGQPYDHNYEVPKDCLNIDMKSTLGTGEYAIVYRGQVRKPDSISNRDVAVKTVKPYSGVQYVRALLKEIKTMIYVGQHPRIIELVGCYTRNLQNAELFIMTELCENGSMEKFLQNNRDSFLNIVEKGVIKLNMLTKDNESSNPVNQEGYANITIEPISSSCFNTIHLLEWTLQIAEGMEFLAQKKVIHGDLATRNVLLDSKFNTKISDFGLSRQLYEYTQYVKKNQAPLPWRWLAIESLKSMRFSTESDVWSFGVMMWEIFTLGDVPYPGLVWGDSFLFNLTDGLRLSKPAYATSDCYNTMLSCWRERPADRMSFPELKFKIREMLDQIPSKNGPEYIDLMS